MIRWRYQWRVSDEEAVLGVERYCTYVCVKWKYVGTLKRKRRNCVGEKIDFSFVFWWVRGKMEEEMMRRQREAISPWKQKKRPTPASKMPLWTLLGMKLSDPNYTKLEGQSSTSPLASAFLKTGAATWEFCTASERFFSPNMHCSRGVTITWRSRPCVLRKRVVKLWYW